MRCCDNKQVANNSQNRVLIRNLVQLCYRGIDPFCFFVLILADIIGVAVIERKLKVVRHRCDLPPHPVIQLLFLCIDISRTMERKWLLYDGRGTNS